MSGWDDAATGQPSQRPMSAVIPSGELGSVTTDIAVLSEQITALRGKTNLIGSPTDTASFREQLKTDRDRARAMARSIGDAIRRARASAAQVKLQKDFAKLGVQMEEVFRAQTARERQVVQAMSASAGVDSPLGTAMGADDPLDGNQLDLQFQEVDMAIVNERASEAEALAKQTAELHELFVDVAQLVDQQGEQIEAIATNVNQTGMAVEKGVDHLHKGLEHQKSSRKCMLIFLAILAVGGGLAILVFQR